MLRSQGVGFLGWWLLRSRWDDDAGLTRLWSLVLGVQGCGSVATPLTMGLGILGCRVLGFTKTLMTQGRRGKAAGARVGGEGGTEAAAGIGPWRGTPM